MKAAITPGAIMTQNTGTEELVLVITTNIDAVPFEV